jgi:hypothetical protein
MARDEEREKSIWGRLRNGKLGRGEGGGEGDRGEEAARWLKVGMWEYGHVREIDGSGRAMGRRGEGNGRGEFRGEWFAAMLVVLIVVGLVVRLVSLRWNRGRGRLGGV